MNYVIGILAGAVIGGIIGGVLGKAAKGGASTLRFNFQPLVRGYIRCLYRSRHWFHNGLLDPQATREELPYNLSSTAFTL